MAHEPRDRASRRDQVESGAYPTVVDPSSEADGVQMIEERHAVFTGDAQCRCDLGDQQSRAVLQERLQPPLGLLDRVPMKQNLSVFRTVDRAYDDASVQ
jgi:hypothetical protein